MNTESGYQSFDQADFDPNSMANQTSSVIMFGVVVDVSPSIRDYVDAMNTALRDVFMVELKNSHRKNDILIKAITFNEDVMHKSGFIPILNLQDDFLETAPSGGGTALYKAVFEALESAINYRNNLEKQGVDVRTNICIITDGEDNSSPQYADMVKKIVQNMRHNEAWINSFTITLIGVGDQANFKGACINMGLDPDKCLVEVSTSAHEIRKQMGVVSQSVSQSGAAGQSVSF